MPTSTQPGSRAHDNNNRCAWVGCATVMADGREASASPFVATGVAFASIDCRPVMGCSPSSQGLGMRRLKSARAGSSTHGWASSGTGVFGGTPT